MPDASTAFYVNNVPLLLPPFLSPSLHPASSSCTPLHSTHPTPDLPTPASRCVGTTPPHIVHFHSGRASSVPSLLAAPRLHGPVPVRPVPAPPAAAALLTGRP
ncbi:hypothetical protein EW145_g8209, partial [Phellinidium pouzarii]